MKKTLLLFALVFFSAMQLTWAQVSTHTLKGKVVDDKGNPVDAALISIKGEGGSETLTNDDGTFEIQVPDGTTQLAVSYSDVNKNVAITDASADIQVTLNTSQSVGEVIVVGAYTKSTKENYVGAASVIDEKQLEKFPVNSVSKAIEGAAPGVQVTNGGGQPGSGAQINIRGFGSFSASNSPLIVVDGAPYAGDLNSINPADIASVTLLKDATATSLYGSRGANGVLVVTTKRGKSYNGKARVSVNAKYGFVTRSLPDYDVIKNQKDYYELSWEAYRNSLVNGDQPYDSVTAGRIASGLMPNEADGIVTSLGGYNAYNVANDQLLDPVTGKLNPNAQLQYSDNWNDALQQVGKYQDYSLSISNKIDNTDYYASFGYLNQEGFYKYSNYQRITGRLNLNTEVNSWLKAGVSVAGSLDDQNYYSGSGTQGGANPFYTTRSIAPIYPVYYRNADGQKEIDPFIGGYKYDWGARDQDPSSSIGNRAYFFNSNVLGSLALDEDEGKAFELITGGYLEASFLKYFKFRTNLNVNYFSGYSTSTGNSLYGQFALQNGFVSKSHTNNLIYTWNQLLSYERYFDKHHLSVTAGHENYDLAISGVSAGGNGMAYFGTTNLAGIAVASTPTSVDDKDRMESYLALANYDFDNKYYLSASIRADGTSRFNKKWGAFWSVGAGWMLNKEEFLRDIDKLNLLKLKVSYGTQGNRSINTYYGWQSLYNIGFPNGTSAGADVSQLENLDYTWESQNELNVGLEFGLFGSNSNGDGARLKGEIDYFNRVNSNLLFFVHEAPSNGGNIGYYDNVMSNVNNGLEISLTGDIIRKKDFTWSVTTNWTLIRDKITKMYNNPDGSPADSLINGNNMFKKGHSRFEYYLVHSAGVDPETGDELYWIPSAEGGDSSTAVYSDASAIGRRYTGTSRPDFFGALTNNMSYKGFDFTFMLSYSVGGKYYDQVYQDLMGAGQLGNNWSTDILNRWTPENPNASLPRVEYNNLDIAQNSDRFLIDASYLSIRNISIGYSFTDRIVKKMKLAGLRIFASADNVWMFTKRAGMDPQADFSGSSAYIYSPARTIVFGLNINF